MLPRYRDYSHGLITSDFDNEPDFVLNNGVQQKRSAKIQGLRIVEPN